MYKQLCHIIFEFAFQVLAIALILLCLMCIFTACTADAKRIKRPLHYKHKLHRKNNFASKAITNITAAHIALKALKNHHVNIAE